MARFLTADAFEMPEMEPALLPFRFERRPDDYLGGPTWSLRAGKVARWYEVSSARWLRQGKPVGVEADEQDGGLGLASASKAGDRHSRLPMGAGGCGAFGAGE
jgi:hypothetical protein